MARPQKTPPRTSRARVCRTVCPVCKSPVESRDLRADRLFPFCSRRCKLVDLGKWFDGEYCIRHEIEEKEQ